MLSIGLEWSVPLNLYWLGIFPVFRSSEERTGKPPVETGLPWQGSWVFPSFWGQFELFSPCFYPHEHQQQQWGVGTERLVLTAVSAVAVYVHGDDTAMDRGLQEVWWGPKAQG